ncbi:MAG: hypothetical protein IJ341_01880 [Bacteroidales bacterium]|nr:hypothetical protein [Bacteroidales bacterium]
MSKDSDYIALVNKYNMLVSHAKELEERIESNETAWKAYAAKMEVMEGHARKLCEKILAKDKEEMTLGTAKSWASYRTDELILRTTDSFDKQVAENISLVQKIYSVASERGQQLDSLKDQIATMLAHGNITNTTLDDVIEEAEKRNKEKREVDKAPNIVKKTASEGTVDLIIVEDNDVDDADSQFLLDMAEKNIETKLTANSIPVSKGDKAVKQLSKAREDAALIHMVDIKPIIDSLCDIDKYALDAIGSKGHSLIKDIYEHIKGKFDSNIYESATRKSLMQLMAKGVVGGVQVSLPLSSRTYSFSLTAMGMRIFKELFNEECVKSEYEKIVAEHDNPEHGYGIMSLKNVLLESGKYIEVTDSVRKKGIPVTIKGQSMIYVPDIIAKTNRYTEYFEYERGTHNQVNFNIKCEKMSKVSKFLNFVAPNRTTVKIIKNKVDSWLKDKDVSKMKGYVIRIGTLASIKNNEPWYVEYKLSNGIEPSVCRI